MKQIGLKGWMLAFGIGGAGLLFTGGSHAAQPLVAPEWAKIITTNTADVKPHTGKVGPKSFVVTVPYTYTTVFRLTTPLIVTGTGEVSAPIGTVGARIGGMFDADEPNNGSAYCLFLRNRYALPDCYILQAATGFTVARQVSVISNIPLDYDEEDVQLNAPKIEHGAFSIPHKFALNLKVTAWRTGAMDAQWFSDGRMVSMVTFPREDDGAVRLTWGTGTLVVKPNPKARAGSAAAIVSVE